MSSPSGFSLSSLTPAQTAGVAMIVSVSFIWVFSSFLVQGIESTGTSPAAITYVANSLFAVCLPAAMLARRRAKRRARRAAEGGRGGGIGGGGDVRGGIGVGGPGGSPEERVALVGGERSGAAARSFTSPTSSPGSPASLGGGDRGGAPASAVSAVGPAAPPPPHRASSREIARAAAIVAPLWFAAQLVYNASLGMTSVTSNTILSSTASLWTYLFSVLAKKETYTHGKLLRIVAILLGTAVVTFADAEASKRVGTREGIQLAAGATQAGHRTGQAAWATDAGHRTGQAGSARDGEGEIRWATGATPAILSSPSQTDPLALLSSPSQTDPLALLSSPSQTDPLALLSSPSQTDPLALLSSPSQTDPLALLSSPSQTDPLATPLSPSTPFQNAPTNVSRELSLPADLSVPLGPDAPPRLISLLHAPVQPTGAVERTEAGSAAGWAALRLAEDASSSSSSALAAPGRRLREGAATGGGGEEAPIFDGGSLAPRPSSVHLLPSPPRPSSVHLLPSPPRPSSLSLLPPPLRRSVAALPPGLRAALGDALCVFSAVLYGLYTLAIRLSLASDDAADTAAFFGTMGLGIFAVGGAGISLLALAGVGPPRATARGLELAALKGLLDNVLSDFLWARSILLIGPTLATAGLALQVPVAALSDALFARPAWLHGGAGPMLGTFLGAALVLYGFFALLLEEKNDGAAVPAAVEAQVEAQGRARVGAGV